MRGGPGGRSHILSHPPLNSPGLETSRVLWAGLPLPELCAAGVRGHQRSLAFPAALTPLPISSTHPLLEPRSSLEKRAALVDLGEESLASSQGDPQQEPRAQVLVDDTWLSTLEPWSRREAEPHTCCSRAWLSCSSHVTSSLVTGYGHLCPVSRCARAWTVTIPWCLE